ncbi:ABC transporter permease [Hymenobacter ginkgonis]|uniref:ABC transporter permease n=1 Tax=Hymenobacter ginkgonis TaxID=2682976 RepID=UPI0018DE9A1B|nr:ABC transporter permease [Hymenobacter ginkgonis]
MAWLALVVGVGVLGPWLPLPYPPATPDLAHIAIPPGWGNSAAAHYFGTDPAGRDVLAELVFGARELLTLSLPATALATLLGASAGGAAGFWGNRGLALPLAIGPLALAAGWWLLALPYWLISSIILLIISFLIFIYQWKFARLGPRRFAGVTLPLPLDSLVLGVATLLSAVPRLVLVVALAAGPPLSTSQLLAVLVLVAWPDTARLVRAQMLRVRVQPFVEAAWASGLPEWRIWWRHALPHACQPLWASAPLSLAGLIGLESTLAFLGIGLLPTTASWGHLLGTLRQEPTAWWLVVGPGSALLFTLLALQEVARQLSGLHSSKEYFNKTASDVTAAHLRTKIK